LGAPYTKKYKEGRSLAPVPVAQKGPACKLINRQGSPTSRKTGVQNWCMAKNKLIGKKEKNYNFYEGQGFSESARPQIRGSWDATQNYHQGVPAYCFDQVGYVLEGRERSRCDS